MAQELSLPQILERHEQTARLIQELIATPLEETERASLREDLKATQEEIVKIRQTIQGKMGQTPPVI
jgi:hypothetical protein